MHDQKPIPKGNTSIKVKAKSTSYQPLPEFKERVATHAAASQELTSNYKHFPTDKPTNFQRSNNRTSVRPNTNNSITFRKE